jgi:CubicO group peptidase (beta-lactamase class C family)
MPEILSRRALMRNLVGAGAAAFAPPVGFAAQDAEDRLNGQERGEMGRLVNEFRRAFSVPAMSVAISRNGRFVYDRVFGLVDRDKALQADQSTLFRIASVTKPITSVTIFSLIEEGKLSLNDNVFGPSGVLGAKYGKPPYKQYVTDITVDHLLTHTCGGWPNDATDPMFQHDGWDQES